MKAKEYAAQFEANPTLEEICAIGKQFILETGDIVKARNARSNAAVLSVLDEQDRKWRALARILDGMIGIPGGVKPDGFAMLVKLVMPVVYDLWQKTHAVSRRA